jgi:gamma-D-glutamyl-L-lysine dipeptidyl-peptidase
MTGSGKTSRPDGSVRSVTHRVRNLALAVGVALLAVAAVRIAGSDPNGASPGKAAASARGPGGAGAESATSARTTDTVTTPARCSSGTCWVAVSVATLWAEPWYPRSIDWPALSNPAHPRRWVTSMSYAQKLWLVGKLETQALYGTKVTVTGHDGTGWTKVAVPSQPTNRDQRGYPGWVPARQLTSTAPAAAGTSAVVRARTAWLWSGWTSEDVAGTRLMEISYGTRLPVVRATPAYVEVSLIGGRRVALRRDVVVLHAAGSSWGATRAKVVAEAKKFRGLAYLWAGTSGFGYDCSGFTYSVYRAYGRTIPRDADRQSVHGTSVSRDSLLPGDLVFFRSSPAGAIGHVGMYLGGGDMIDSPQTGKAVRVEPVSAYPYYAGARRYLSR